MKINKNLACPASSPASPASSPASPSLPPHSLQLPQRPPRLLLASSPASPSLRSPSLHFPNVLLSFCWPPPQPALVSVPQPINTQKLEKPKKTNDFQFPSLHPAPQIPSSAQNHTFSIPLPPPGSPDPRAIPSRPEP